VIDAVGLDAATPAKGPASESKDEKKEFQQEMKKAAPEGTPSGEAFHPGEAPLRHCSGQWNQSQRAEQYRSSVSIPRLSLFP
jgi:hypothetical protein